MSKPFFTADDFAPVSAKPSVMDLYHTTISPSFAASRANERVAPLVIELERLKAWRSGTLAERQAALDIADERLEEVTRLREALQFYADETNWEDGDNSSPTDLDCGERARKALEKK